MILWVIGPWLMRLEWGELAHAESFWHAPCGNSDVLKALLRMKAASEPSATEEQQFTRSLGFKS